MRRSGPEPRGHASRLRVPAHVGAAPLPRAGRGYPFADPTRRARTPPLAVALALSACIHLVTLLWLMHPRRADLALIDIALLSPGGPGSGTGSRAGGRLQEPESDDGTGGGRAPSPLGEATTTAAEPPKARPRLPARAAGVQEPPPRRPAHVPPSSAPAPITTAGAKSTPAARHAPKARDPRSEDVTAPPIPVASAAPTALALAGTTDGDTGAGGAAGDAGASGLGGQVGGSGERGGAHGAGGSGGDLRAACIECPAPEYPRQAERQGWEGSVDLRLRIHTDGRVAEVAVVRPSGFDVLDAAAVAAARRSRFRLAVELQRAGDVWGRMRYRFELDG